MFVRDNRGSFADGRVCALAMFGSDTQAPAHPKILEAIVAANDGRAGSYGADEWSAKALAAVQHIFETDDLDMYLVGTGGAANGLALSLLCPPWGAVLAHGAAHVLADEGSGPEHFTSGARMISVGGGHSMLIASDLDRVAQQFSCHNVHAAQPRAVTLTNLSENGLAYSVDQIGALSEVCRANQLSLHMDGARFANALVAKGACPGDVTWRAGVDALSFGLTKNGGACAEALIVFGASRNIAAPYLRKRSGHLFSKQRYMAAQFVAMLENDLWLELAACANTKARQLESVLRDNGCRIVFSVDGNQVFAQMSSPQHQALVQTGIDCYPWPAAGQDVFRFVSCWQTDSQDIAHVQMALATIKHAGLS